MLVSITLTDAPESTIIGIVTPPTSTVKSTLSGCSPFTVKTWLPIVVFCFYISYSWVTTPRVVISGLFCFATFFEMSFFLAFSSFLSPCWTFNVCLNMSLVPTRKTSSLFEICLTLILNFWIMFIKFMLTYFIYLFHCDGSLFRCF